MIHALANTSPAELTSGTEERLLRPARRAGYDLPVIGTSEEPEGDVCWQAPSGHWWVIADRRDDPTAERYGGVVVPERERAKLAQLLREGFSPDRILVGHEFPLGWTPGDPVPDLVPTASRELVPRSPQEDRRAELTNVSVQATATLGRAALTATKALAVGALAVGVAIGRAAAELDPIVIAGVRDPRTGAVTWVEVARWSW